MIYREASSLRWAGLFYDMAVKCILRLAVDMIRSGEAIQQIRSLPQFVNGSQNITRDGFHMNFLYGRYAVALMWAAAITGMNAMHNSFVPEVEFMTGMEADELLLNEIKEIVFRMAPSSLSF